MAITFAIRGDQLDARYSSAGATAAKFGTTAIQAVTSDVAGINGSTSIKLDNGAAALVLLGYPGRGNTPSDRPRSVLIRGYFPSLAANSALFAVGGFTRNPTNFMAAYVDTTGDVNTTIGNATGASDTSSTATAPISATTWHDIVLTWDGTTTANGFEIWVDGTRLIQDTMIRSLTTPYTADDQNACEVIHIGAELTQVFTRMYVDEFVIWDSVITPSSVGLTSGTGSLNGASRTAYVDVAAFDGLAATGGSSTAGLGLPGLRA